MVNVAGSPDTFRWRDFVALGEDDVRELIDGALVEVEMPSKWHEHIVSTLAAHLLFWARKNKRGRVLSSGYRVRIDDHRGVMPDVQLLAEETYRRADPKGLENGHPELVVEVISPTSRTHDRVLKLEWYRKIGVPQYWIIDPEARTLEHLVLQPGGHYLIVESLAGNATFRPSSFEGFELNLEELWDSMDSDSLDE